MDIITLDAEGLVEWQSQNMEGKRYEYDLVDGDLVLDIGAYRGEFASLIASIYHGVKIICFEPTGHCPDFHNPHIVTVHKAASDFNGHIEMGGDYLYTSVFTKKGSRSFPSVDISNYCRDFKEISLCKINIEGGEYDLLYHMCITGMTPKIKNLQVQFHKVEGLDWEKRYETISKMLEPTHAIEWRVPFVWESWKRK